MEKLEGSMTQLLESRQKRINALETAVKEYEAEKSDLAQKLEVLKLKVRHGPLFSFPSRHRFWLKAPSLSALSLRSRPGTQRRAWKQSSPRP